MGADLMDARRSEEVLDAAFAQGRALARASAVSSAAAAAAARSSSAAAAAATTRRSQFESART